MAYKPLSSYTAEENIKHGKFICILGIIACIVWTVHSIIEICQDGFNIMHPIVLLFLILFAYSGYSGYKQGKEKQSKK